MQAIIETFPNFMSATIIIRQNVITGNSVLDDGGGVRLRCSGEGAETFIVSDNTIDQNT